MYIAQATIKGQVLIPVELRKKYHIEKGSQVAFLEREEGILIKPLMKNPIDAGCGFLKGGPSILKELIRDRKREAAL